MVISLILLLIPLSSSLEFNFSSPVSIELNETFKVSISLDTQENYDVKIFVHNSSDSSISRAEIISMILADKWQDSWLYIPSSFPSKKEYELKVTESSGDRELCVQLRKTNKTSYFKECKSILVNLPGDYPPTQINEDNLPESNNLSLQPLEDNKDAPIQTDNLSNLSIAQNEEVIFLNPSPSQEFSTKQDTLRSFIIYSSLVLSTLALIALILKPRI